MRGNVPFVAAWRPGVTDLRTNTPSYIVVTMANKLTLHLPCTLSDALTTVAYCVNDISVTTTSIAKEANCDKMLRFSQHSFRCRCGNCSQCSLTCELNQVDLKTQQKKSCLRSQIAG
jgi:hypothetical protein